MRYLIQPKILFRSTVAIVAVNSNRYFSPNF